MLGIQHGKYCNTKGSATLGITALGMVVAYLLLLVVGAIGALSVLIWLFQEDTPDANRRTGREAFGSLRSADHFGARGTSSAEAEPEHAEDKAA
jgi:hypothetical protein